MIYVLMAEANQEYAELIICASKDKTLIEQEKARLLEKAVQQANSYGDINSALSIRIKDWMCTGSIGDTPTYLDYENEFLDNMDMGLWRYLEGLIVVEVPEPDSGVVSSTETHDEVIADSRDLVA